MSKILEMTAEIVVNQDTGKRRIRDYLLSGRNSRLKVCLKQVAIRFRRFSRFGRATETPFSLLFKRPIHEHSLELLLELGCSAFQRLSKSGFNEGPLPVPESSI